MMDRNKLLLLVGGIVAILVVVGLTWLGIARTFQPSNTTNGVVYTDSISGQKLTGFPQTGIGDEGGEVNEPLNETPITGLDDFFSTLDQDQGQGILNSLTTFIHAHTGPHGTRAGVLNGQVTKTGSSPTTYNFTLILVNPAASYQVTITMPDNTTSAAQVTFGKVTP